MLIMKCPKCNNYISSALLAEIATIACEHCGVEVAVKNVLVSSNGFTFDRQDLLKRFFRYRKLLDEVIDEHNSMTENQASSAVSKSSIHQFLSILQGMMTGARDHFRLQFSDPLQVKVSYDRHECHGIFYNLSMAGARIEISASNPLPRVKGQVSIQFLLPEQQKKFSIAGVICWTEKANGHEGSKSKHSVGVKFSKLDSASHSDLWQFISKSASQKQQ